MAYHAYVKQNIVPQHRWSLTEVVSQKQVGLLMLLSIKLDTSIWLLTKYARYLFLQNQNN